MKNHVNEISAWPTFFRIWIAVCALLVLCLIALWFCGYGPLGNACQEASTAYSEAQEVDGDDSKPATFDASTSVAQEPFNVPYYTFNEAFSAARVFFDVGSATLSDQGKQDLTAVIEHLIDNPSQVAVLSGYHDPSGDLATNQELAKQRALAVQEYLLSQGLSKANVVLEKPVETLGDGDSFAESRRVEVRPASLD